MEDEEQLQQGAEFAALQLSAVVAGLIRDDIDRAAIAVALCRHLGAMLAEAPRDMADTLDQSILNRIRRRRAEVWAEIDAAAPTH